MADLIDRRTAYIFLTEYYNHRTEAQHKNLKEALSRVPEAVVHCKDCILHGVCAYERGLGKDGFCSQGKRAEDD